MVSDKKGVIFPNFQFLKSNLFLPTETQTSLGFRAGMFSSGWRLILNFYWEKTMIRLNLKNDLGSLHISPEPHCKFKLVIIWPRSIIRNVHYLSLLSTFLLLNLLIFITCPKVCVGGGGKGGGGPKHPKNFERQKVPRLTSAFKMSTVSRSNRVH